MMNKKILIIDLTLILGSLLTIFVFVGYTQPLVIGSLPDSENSLMFTFSSADYLLIDNNLKFESSKTAFINDRVDLESGRYFIKAVSGLSSEIREISTELKISLEISKFSDGSVGVFNVGDSALQVETYKVGVIVNSSLISVDDSSLRNGGNN